jgi:hypothetical protein
MPLIITQVLSAALFWDVNLETLDWEKHKMLIVDRVIQRGTYKEFNIVLAYYGKEKMAQIIKELSFLPPKDLAFVITFFELKPSDLKCYLKKQLVQNYLD